MELLARAVVKMKDQTTKHGTPMKAQHLVDDFHGPTNLFSIDLGLHSGFLLAHWGKVSLLVLPKNLCTLM